MSCFWSVLGFFFPWGRESAQLIRHEATNSYLVSRYEDVERVFNDRAGEFTTDNYDWQIEPV
ncbi:hypothetical protein PUR34_01370, partial [Streptomyces sp. JV185]|nr:hypothetical protein [Streptomyces sp. JV185]